MIFKLRFLLIALIALNIFACSGAPEKKEIVLSGSVVGYMPFSQSYDQPIFIVVVKGSDMEKIEGNPEDYIIAIVSVDLTTRKFRINLTDKEVSVGDEISLFAFMDKDFKDGMPYPSTGDIAGFYFAEGDLKLSPTYVLKEGENNGFDIELNRDVYDFDAHIQGNVLDTQGGDLTIIAYTGEITTSNTSEAIDYKAVIGYDFIENAKGDVPYDMEIIPYGFNVPIEHVYLFALLDVNRNNEMDGGDKLGIYTISEDDYPTQITINEGTATGFNIEYAMDITDPSGYDISLTGNLILPEMPKTKTAPSYIFVFKTDNPGILEEDPISHIKYFEKIPAGENTFDISLSDTDLVPGDKIMIAALWDKDFNGGFPEPTLQDFIGLYMDEDEFAATYTLKDGVNSGLSIDLNREVFDFDSEIRGTINGSDAGEMLLVAYAGEITSFSFDTDTFDLDKVIAYKELTKGSSPLDYALTVFPYGMNVPMENVSVIALLDKNENGKPDGGDRVGFYTNPENKMPKPILVDEGVIKNIDIEFLMDIPKPSGYEMTVSGNITFNEYNDSPVYLIVAKTDDPSTLLEDMVSAIKHFEKLPQGATEYSLSLKATDLMPGDEIMVLAFQDNDNNGSFPNPTAHDFVGFYLDREKMHFTCSLVEGENSGINVNLSREVFDFKSQVKGTVNGNDAGDLLIVAYAGEMNSFDFSALDLDKAIGYQKYQKDSAPFSYTLDILPYGMDVPISDVYIAAILDKNGNGMPDGGDIVGFPLTSDSEFPIPKLYTISEGSIENVNIDMALTLPEPSGYTMSVAGYFEPPAGYAQIDMPVFVVVTRADRFDKILENPLSYIEGFQKIPPGENEFYMDLSTRGLEPGDDIYVFALWDRDFTSGLPDITEGDYIGAYLKPDLSDPHILTTLKEGKNTIVPEEGYEFKLNRKIYEHEASVTIAFNSWALPNSFDDDGDGEELDPGDEVIVGLIQKEGVYNGAGLNPADILSQPPDVDFNYVIGYQTIVIDGSATYTVPVLPAIYEMMTFDNFLDDIYIVAILDENGNGLPDKEEYIGYYWCQPAFSYYWPQTVDLKNENYVLKRSVRFSKFKFSNFIK